MNIEILLEAAKFIEVQSQQLKTVATNNRIETKGRNGFSNLCTSLMNEAKTVHIADSTHLTAISTLSCPSQSVLSINQQASILPSYVPKLDELIQDSRKKSNSGTREVHNKLEKYRRAHLKECFELLKKQLPNPEDRKASNLSILRSSLRYIQILKKNELECEKELERLARDKIIAQQRLVTLKKELGQWDHINTKLSIPNKNDVIETRFTSIPNLPDNESSTTSIRNAGSNLTCFSSTLAAEKHANTKECNGTQEIRNFEYFENNLNGARNSHSSNECNTVAIDGNLNADLSLEWKKIKPNLSNLEPISNLTYEHTLCLEDSKKIVDSVVVLPQSVVTNGEQCSNNSSSISLQLSPSFLHASQVPMTQLQFVTPYEIHLMPNIMPVAQENFNNKVDKSSKSFNESSTALVGVGHQINPVTLTPTSIFPASGSGQATIPNVFSGKMMHGPVGVIQTTNNSNLLLPVTDPTLSSNISISSDKGVMQFVTSVSGMTHTILSSSIPQLAMLSTQYNKGSQTDNSITCSNREKKILQEKIDKTYREIEDLCRQISEEQSALVREKSIAEEYDEALRKASMETSGLGCDISAMLKETESLQNQIRELERQRQENERMKKETDHKKMILVEKRCKLEKGMEEVSSCNERMLQSIERSKCEIRAIQEKVVGLENDIEVKEMEIEKQKNQIQELTNEKFSVEAELDKKQTYVAEMKEDLLNTKRGIEKVQRDYECGIQHSSEMKNLRDNKQADHEKQLQEKRNELGQCKSKILSSEQEVTRLKNEVLDMQVQLQGEKSKASEIKQELDKVNTINCSLDNERCKLLEEIFHIKKDFESNECERKHIQAEMDSLVNELEALKCSNRRSREEYETMKYQNIENIACIQKELGGQVDLKRRLQEDAETLSKRIQDHEKRFQQLHKELDEKNKILREENNERKNVKEEIESLLAEESQLKINIDKFRLELDKPREELERLKSDINKQESEHQQISEEQKQLETELHKVRKEAENVKKQAQEQVKDEKKKIVSLEKKIADIEKKLKEIENESVTKESTIFSTREELYRLQSKLMEIRKEHEVACVALETTCRDFDLVQEEKVKCEQRYTVQLKELESAEREYESLQKENRQLRNATEEEEKIRNVEKDEFEKLIRHEVEKREELEKNLISLTNKIQQEFENQLNAEHKNVVSLQYELESMQGALGNVADQVCRTNTPVK